VFYLLEILISFLEALDERRVSVELETMECGLQGIWLCLDFRQSSGLIVLTLDVKNPDLVNALTQRDWGKNVLDWLRLDSRVCHSVWFVGCLIAPKMLLKCLSHSLHHVVPIPPISLAKKTHTWILECAVAFEAPSPIGDFWY